MINMANQSDRTGHNFNSGSAMQQQANTNKAEGNKNKNNPQYKGNPKDNDKSGKSGKQGGCC